MAWVELPGMPAFVPEYMGWTAPAVCNGLDSGINPEKIYAYISTEGIFGPSESPDLSKADAISTAINRSKFRNEPQELLSLAFGGIRKITMK
jgi:hypothetical protein